MRKEEKKIDRRNREDEPQRKRLEKGGNSNQTRKLNLL